MTDDAWLPDALERRVLELFQLPAETRACELEALCDAEPEHADQIRALAALGASTVHAAAAPPARIGPYCIVSVLGEGGMGTVYLAEQETPVRRLVALKLIKLGMDSKQVVARFASERQTLASMNHPNIAQVFDGGLSAEGRPYFVMEYVDGEPIHRFCETHQLDLRARLELFRDVCAGVQHAHQRGVLHRDLKPTNVLVARENRVARPKIIDFGLARAIDTDDADRSLFTVEGQLLGTPGYMSPEQADASFAAIDTRTDVYSLGVVLYQLLVGKLPFDADSMRGIPLSELQRRIREDEPARPSARAAAIAKSMGEPPVPWIRRLRGDLDCIVMHCLEKEPDRRYRSPAALSEDLARFLNSEAVEARPPSRAYRLRKLARRHRGLVLAISAVFVVLAGGIVGTGLGLESALDANEQLEVQRKIAVGKTADAERSLERATEVKRVLVEMLALTNPIFAQGRDTSLLRMVLDRTAERLFDGSIVDRATRGELHAIIADVYFNLAAWDEARRHFRALIDLGGAADAPPELGPASEPILDAKLELARIEIMTGDASRASECLGAARRAIHDVLPPNHPLTIELGLREVELLDRTANPDVIDKARDVVANARAHLGVGSRLTLEAMQTLASFESRSGHPDTANALMLEVEAGQAARYGPESAPVQLARAARLSILEQQGNAEEALELARQMHTAFTKTFGADSPRTQAMEGAIGRQLANLGRSDEAIPILERYFALEQQMIGSHRALLMRTPSILVLSYSEVGRTEAALELARRVVESMTEAYGADDDTTLMNRANVGALLHALGRDVEAEAVLVDVRDRATRANGADSGAAIQALLSVRSVFHALGKLDEACAAGEAYVAARRRTSGDDHPLTRTAIEDLIHAYEAAGRDADAKHLRDG